LFLLALFRVYFGTHSPSDFQYVEAYSQPSVFRGWVYSVFTELAMLKKDLNFGSLNIPGKN